MGGGARFSPWVTSSCQSPESLTRPCSEDGRLWINAESSASRRAAGLGWKQLASSPCFTTYLAFGPARIPCQSAWAVVQSSVNERKQANTVFSKILMLSVSDQQPQYPLGPCWRRRFSGPVQASDSESAHQHSGQLTRGHTKAWGLPPSFFPEHVTSFSETSYQASTVCFFKSPCKLAGILAERGQVNLNSTLCLTLSRKFVLQSAPPPSPIAPLWGRQNTCHFPPLGDEKWSIAEVEWAVIWQAVIYGL